MDFLTVALYMSAWIEIGQPTVNLAAGTVALYMSAWIEIIVDYIHITEQASRTLHECVD